MGQFSYSHFKEAKTIKEVIEELKYLDDGLRNTDLQNLIAFNHTYLIITRNVFKRFGKNYFQNDDLMERIDVNFGNYYFSSLKKYLKNKPCPPAWKILFDNCIKDNKFQFIYMALGVNAHVNNDLPQTLDDVMKGSRFQYDFLLINEIIKHSLHEVVRSLHEKNRAMNIAKNIFESVYAKYLNNLISEWRNDAWNSYLKLIENKTTVQKIELKAKKKAENITYIRSILDLKKILSR